MNITPEQLESNLERSARMEREQRQRAKEQHDALMALAEKAIARAGFCPQEMRSERISDDGDSGKNTIYFEAPRYMKKEALLEWIREHWNTHCQHSYDCCGRVYGNVNSNTLRFLGADSDTAEWQIEWSWHRNI